MSQAINSRQRAFLRSMAHGLKPVIHVGAGGVTETVAQSVAEAFNSRELLKVKVLQGAPLSAREAGDVLVAALPDVQVAQTIGHTVVLYRRHPERPEIRLPG